MATTTTLRANGWREYARLQSHQDPSKVYRVDQHEDTGQFRCQCKGFVFSKEFHPKPWGAQKVCKHLKKMFAHDAQPVAQPRPVLLDQATEMLHAVLDAGRIYAAEGPISKMALVLAQKLAEFAPAALPPDRAPAQVTVAVQGGPGTGVRVILFDDD